MAEAVGILRRRLSNLACDTRGSSASGYVVVIATVGIVAAVSTGGLGDAFEKTFTGNVESSAAPALASNGQAASSPYGSPTISDVSLPGSTPANTSDPTAGNHTGDPNGDEDGWNDPIGAPEKTIIGGLMENLGFAGSDLAPEKVIPTPHRTVEPGSDVVVGKSVGELSPLAEKQLLVGRSFDLAAEYRKNWAQDPSGEKPIAAWNLGDVVGALLGDFFLDTTGAVGFHDDVPTSLVFSKYALAIRPSRLAAPEPEQAEDFDVMSLRVQRQLEIEAQKAAAEAESLGEKIADFEERGARLDAKLAALEAFKDAKLGNPDELDDLALDLSNARASIDEMLLLLKLKQSAAAWSSKHPGMSLDPNALALQMGAKNAEGVLAEARALYAEGNMTSADAMRLLSELAGSDQHDKAVQQMLLAHEKDIDALVYELEGRLETELRIDSTAEALNEHIAAIKQEQAETAQRYGKLLAERNGLDAYFENEDAIRGLTNQVNTLAETHAAQSALLEKWNSIAEQADIAGYQKAELPKALETVKNPPFKLKTVRPVDQSIRLNSRFGNRFHPIDKKWKLHAGIDFAAPEGTSVKAAARGTVTYARCSGSGCTVEIDHGLIDGERVKTRYLHLSYGSFKKREGQTVSAGDVIALSGNTGHSTGPHLHFEYHVGGQPVDPAAACGFH